MPNSILQHTQSQKQTACFSINQVCHNKTHHYDEPKTWDTYDGSVEDLANQVKKGKAFMVGLLPEDKTRSKKNVVGFNAIAFDIDSDLTIEEALDLPIVKDYCGLIYTSHSHQKTKYIEPSKKYPNGREIEPCDRYRLVFALPNLIDDVDLYPYLWDLMFNEHFPMADVSCKDISRIYFGNDETEIIECDPSKVLPESILDDARFKRELDNAEKQDKAIKKPNYDYDPQETEKLVYEALDYIPPRAYGTGNYNECLRVLMALENEFGKDKAIDIAEKWSPSQPPSKDGKKWNVPYKVNSLNRSGITIGTLFFVAEQHGFKMPEKTVKTKSTGKSLSVNTLKKDDVISLIDEIINGNYSGSKLSVKLKELELETGWKKHELEKLYHQRLEEIELEETKEDRKKELDELLKVGTKTVKFSDVFEGNLAKALDNAREHLSGANSEGLISSILPIISSMIPIGNLINLDYGFIVKPIFWVCIVAKSSSKKSVVQDKLCEPLMKVIDQELEEKYQQEIQQWKRDCISAKENNEPKPPQPEREFVMIDDSTMEKLMQILQYQKGRGLLLRKDEFSGFFDSMNAYKSGKGDDVQKWLQIRNGRELTITRVTKDDNGRNYYSVPSPNISVLGTIQPQTLIKTINKMGGFEDHNGMISRICFSELKLTKIGQRKRGKYYVDISEFLAGFYKKLRALEPKQYSCTNEAIDYYNDWYNQLEHYSERYAQSDSGLSNVYAKMQGRTGELALILHLANACLRDETPNEEISLETMEAAVKLSSYYIDQYRKFRLDHEEQQKSDQNALPPLLKAIVEVATKKQDWITPRDVTRGYQSKFKGYKSKDVIKLFDQLVDLGYGKTETKGKTTKFRLTNDINDINDKDGCNPDTEQVLPNDKNNDIPTTNSTTNSTTTTTTTTTTNKSEHIKSLGYEEANVVDNGNVVEDVIANDKNNDNLKSSNDKASSDNVVDVVDVVEADNNNDFTRLTTSTRPDKAESDENKKNKKQETKVEYTAPYELYIPDDIYKDSPRYKAIQTILNSCDHWKKDDLEQTEIGELTKLAERASAIKDILDVSDTYSESELWKKDDDELADITTDVGLF